MEILLLIGLNLPTVPFLHQAEHGKKAGAGPNWRCVLRLSEARHALWFRPFCWMAALYLATIALAWQAIGADVDPRIFLNLLVMQTLLWSAVLWARALRHRELSSGAKP